MDISTLDRLFIEEGEVQSLSIGGTTLWTKPNSAPYIVSNGTQAIDTGVYCTSTMSCEIKIAWTAFPTNATYIGAIEYNGGSYRRCHFQLSISGSDRVLGFWQDSPTIGNPVSIAYDTSPHILTYSAPNMTVGIDGNTATHGNSPTPYNSTFYLFDRNVVGFTANSEPGRCKLYYAKFWDNGILIRDFIPAKDSDGKAALYDIVNGQYYYDINGNDLTYSR